MSRIFVDGKVCCMGCLRVWSKEETKRGDPWLRRGFCPRCHKKLRRSSRLKGNTRYILTNMGELKRREDLDSRPILFVQARKR